MIDLATLPKEIAILVQHGLRDLGLYQGSTRGMPGPKTEAAFQEFLASRAGGSGSSFAEHLAAIAESQIGVREKGNNGGEDVRKFQRATWLDLGPWAWCAAFVCWCYREALKRGDDPGFKRPRTAGAWDFERWARDQGANLLKPPGPARRGDIIIFTFSHIGVCVLDQKGNRIETVEGNTNPGGGREGDGVYRKTRESDKVRSLIRF